MERVVPRWWLSVYIAAVVVLFASMALLLVADAADAGTRRLPCRDTVSYGLGQDLIKEGWVGDPTDGKEALYGPRGTCILIAV
jgi:hypothetical protein